MWVCGQKRSVGVVGDQGHSSLRMCTCHSAPWRGPPHTPASPHVCSEMSGRGWGRGGGPPLLTAPRACERGQGCAWDAPPPGRAEPPPSSAESPVAPAPWPSLGTGGPAVLSDGSSLLSGCAPRQRDPAGLLQRPERPLHLAAPLRRRQLLPGQRRPRRGEACGRARGSRGACPAERQGLRRGRVRPPLGCTPGNGWGRRPQPDVPWLSPPARATGTAAGPRALRAAPQPPRASRAEPHVP